MIMILNAKEKAIGPLTIGKTIIMTNSLITNTNKN